MEEDLDHILLAQLHVARRLGSKMKKAKKVMGDDPLLIELQKRNEKRIQFLEDMIEDKNILHKKVKKKKKENPDVLARNPFYEAWRATFMITMLSYRTFTEYMTSYWKNNKKEEK